MFSGIVEALSTVNCIEKTSYGVRLGIGLENRDGLEKGASVAINGVCLTAVEWDQDSVYFDVIVQTLQLTNLDQLKVGQQVNTERSLSFGKELGGHLVSGHVDVSVEVKSIDSVDGEHRVWFSLPAELSKYIFDKGFVALDGCSLTVAEVEPERFAVCFIPETLEVTTHGDRSVGRRVNLEIDRQTQAVVDTVERVLAAKGVAS